MNNIQIGDGSGEMLALLIKKNSGLRQLHFSSNNLQRGIIQISKALQCISTLESLDLSNNQIPEKTGCELAAAIKSNHSLKQLRLHSNNLKSSIVVILQALSELSTLELLDFHDSHLTSLAAKGFVIKNNTGLKWYINDNNLGKSLITILKALKSISSLEKLSINNNGFMNDGIANLRVANKMRLFLESFYQCRDDLDCSELFILKKLCNASELQTRVTLVEEAETALAYTLQNNPGLQELHWDNHRKNAM